MRRLLRPIALALYGVMIVTIAAPPDTAQAAGPCDGRNVDDHVKILGIFYGGTISNQFHFCRNAPRQWHVLDSDLGCSATLANQV